MGSIALKVSQVSKKYKIKSKKSYFTKSTWEDFWALKDISFEMKKGEVIGVIGQNGSGKSTLLKILARITKPNKGIISYEGRLGALLEVGTGFHPELSGRENIFLSGTLLGMKKTHIRAKLNDIIEFAGVGTHLEKPVKYYSTGMFVRLAFAVAAFLDTDILLLDEVLSVGDAEFQHKCLNKISEIQESKSVIFVSHHMPSITRLTHKTIHLHQGQIVNIGDSKKITSQYLERYLKIDAEFTCESIETAPGNDIVRLLAVHVHDANLQSNRFFEINQSFGVSMEYIVLEEGHKIYPAYNFYLESGINIFDTHDITSDWNKKPKTKGCYVSTVWVPANLLNTGYITIGAAILSNNPFHIHLHQKDIIGFNMVNSQAKHFEQNYEDSIPGLIHPKLDWDLKKKPS